MRGQFIVCRKQPFNVVGMYVCWVHPNILFYKQCNPNVLHFLNACMYHGANPSIRPIKNLGSNWNLQKCFKSNVKYNNKRNNTCAPKHSITALLTYHLTNLTQPHMHTKHVWTYQFEFEFAVALHYGLKSTPCMHFWCGRLL